MINEERRKAVVQAIINIAGVFGHDVIAEGVETYEQRAALAEMGCHAIQGFYIATPMPEDQVPAWIPG
jgi:EAL domain-containing protein (putative c-di-GMP-specific phosphodiesterase class I)